MKWLLMAILVVALILVPGCAALLSSDPADEATSEASPPGDVATLDVYGSVNAENWDADPEADGLEVNVYPKDIKGRLVQTPGIVSAELWLQKEWGESEKGLLVQTWSGIEVSEGEYDWQIGATVRLEYSGFTPNEGQWGILEVTFTTLDGKSFTTREKNALLWKR